MGDSRAPILGRLYIGIMRIFSEMSLLELLSIFGVQAEIAGLRHGRLLVQTKPFLQR
jgi:hypothetical protein